MTIHRFAFLVPAAVAATAHGQVLLTGTNPAYSQNFNSLASSGTGNAWANNSTLTGWYVFRSGSSVTSGVRNATTAAATAYAGGNGGSATGALYSFGPTGSDDRALGTVGSGNANAGDYSYGLVLQNQTGRALSGFTLSFVGEQWRNGGAANSGNQNLEFDYRIGTSFAASDFNASTTSGFTRLTTADFTSPVTTVVSGGQALDGNAAANRLAGLGGTVATTIAPGAFIILRWWDDDHTGSDHGLAIDDFRFSATTQSDPGEPVPEPATLALGAAGLIGALRRRNRRRG